MATTIEAVYQDGVFKPRQEVDLDDGACVQLVIRSNSQAEVPRQAPDPRKAAEILRAIAAMPMEPGGEEFSGRDHDRILYGGENGPR